MEKKMIQVHAFTVHIYTVAIALLILLVVVLGFRYLHLKMSLENYTRSTIWMNQQGKPMGQISDYAVIIAAGASQYVASADLQNYVTTVSKDLKRDVVVLDKDQKILADTIPANKGAMYTFDTNGVIRMTLSDAASRTFEELSKDYPNGIMEVVVPMKNAKGETIGAVLVSNTQVFH
ncbi:MAG TPA: hypothetical protein VMR59_02000 [Patescibacteria group bacterium]|jgi:hypothetical protein|nr:hypothetical protein [Patescibacteria group bacterium]